MFGNNSMKAHTDKPSQAAEDSVQLPDYLRQAEFPRTIAKPTTGKGRDYR
jgi:hypothetical protein